MKLIKINPDHYVIVNDSPIEEGGEIEKGDWYYLPRTNYVYLCEENPTELNLERHCGTAKVTHSTQRHEYSDDSPSLKMNCMGCNVTFVYDETKLISLQEVKELIGEVDVGKKANEYARLWVENDIPYYAFIQGYNQALEDNKEKKYTEEDMRKAIEMAQSQYWDIDNRGFSSNTEGDWSFKYTEEEIIQSLQPKTEWEVEFVDGKLKLKS